jgi:hypothetical protein
MSFFQGSNWEKIFLKLTQFTLIINHLYSDRSQFHNQARYNKKPPQKRRSVPDGSSFFCLCEGMWRACERIVVHCASDKFCSTGSYRFFKRVATKRLLGVLLLDFPVAAALVRTLEVVVAVFPAPTHALRCSGVQAAICSGVQVVTLAVLSALALSLEQQAGTQQLGSKVGQQLWALSSVKESPAKTNVSINSCFMFE